MSHFAIQILTYYCVWSSLSFFSLVKNVDDFCFFAFVGRLANRDVYFNI